MKRETTPSPFLRSSAPATPEIEALHRRFEAEWQSLQQARRVRRLGRALLGALGLLPEGRELLIWFSGAGRDNRSVLDAWIARELGEPDFETDCGSGSEVETLLGRLQRRLQWPTAANDDDGA